MRRPALALALSVGAFVLVGCATADKSIFEGGSSITATVPNPVGKRELAVAEQSYQAAGKAFLVCRRTRCTSTANLRQIQRYDREVVYPALVAARRAVRDNPNVSGLSAVRAFQQAVADYQKAVKGS